MSNYLTSSSEPLSSDDPILSLSSDDATKAVAIWSEDIILEPGNIRFPIRVVMVDDHFRTRLDRLVKLPDNCKTYIYRVLDHGIPWQHLDAGLTLEEVKSRVAQLARGKRLVLYDAWQSIGSFDFKKDELNEFTICDLKDDSDLNGSDGVQAFWNLVKGKLGHVYSGKPGHYDTIELADFVMSVYLKNVSLAAAC